MSNINDFVIEEGVLKKYCGEGGAVVIPDGVTSIGDYAFQYCIRLTNITIPDGVTSIGNGAFSGCTSLTSITIPDGVTSIDEYAFYGCQSLTSITIPDGVTSIGKWAFCGCISLERVYYKGTASNWKKISIDRENTALREATRFCYSETKPTRSGNYWHYVDGEPTIW